MNNSNDPLSVLHGEELPVQPDPAFAAALRARLESAVNLFENQPDRTEGVVMSGTDTAIAELTEPPVAAGPPRPAALPYLTVRNAREAIAWYVDALGAALIGDPIVMGDGSVGHAELAIAGGVLYLADEYSELGLKAPAPQEVSVSLMLPVPDTDSALERARSRGAHVQREVYEDHGERNATIVDPFGHRWMLAGPLTGTAAPIRHGDVGYVSLWTPDAVRAAAFYHHVLGWTYDPATHRVTNTTMHLGIFGVGRSTLFCCYAVADLGAARQAILDGGGTVDDPAVFDFGTVLGATDSQGTEFAVFEPTGDTPRPELNGAGPGELSYITHLAQDSAEFKSFYSRVLHWTFEAGHVPDGWQVDQTHPMAGVAGGAQSATTVPMWTVSDIDDAVQRVREAGGSVVQEPSQQPYGLMAECTDDQGGRFYLGQF